MELLKERGAGNLAASNSQRLAFFGRVLVLCKELQFESFGSVRFAFHESSSLMACGADK